MSKASKNTFFRYCIIAGFMISAMMLPFGNSGTAADLKTNMKPLVASAVIGLPLEEVWRLWTTAEGIQSFMAPKAIVELKPAGMYEVHFLPDAPRGQRGSEFSTVLAVEPMQFLSVSWKLPPYLPAVKDQLTSLQFYFEEKGDNATQLTIIHAGWGYSDEWQQARAYFEKNWPAVLTLMQEKAAEDGR